MIVFLHIEMVIWKLNSYCFLLSQATHSSSTNCVLAPSSQITAEKAVRRELTNLQIPPSLATICWTQWCCSLIITDLVISFKCFPTSLESSYSPFPACLYVWLSFFPFLESVFILSCVILKCFVMRTFLSYRRSQGFSVKKWPSVIQEQMDWGWYGRLSCPSNMASPCCGYISDDGYCRHLVVELLGQHFKAITLRSLQWWSSLYHWIYLKYSLLQEHRAASVLALSLMLKS